MAVLTRPEAGERAPETAAEPHGPPEPMNTRLANALVVGAPMTRVQLDTVRLHFEKLAQMMLISGPAFSPMRRAAVDMHNKTVRRINAINEEARRRARDEEDERLLEIEQ
jgi:hypothetical protein